LNVIQGFANESTPSEYAGVVNDSQVIDDEEGVIGLPEPDEGNLLSV
jgi:hypothetical protein